MFDEEDMVIDDKRYDEIIRIGFESAMKNINHFESKYSCSFSDINPLVKDNLTPEEYDEWRFSYIALKSLRDKVN